MSNSTSIFELNSGQKIQLVELNQSLTYEGHIGGRPNELSNAKIIEHAVEDAKRPHHEGAPYLLEPVQYEIELDEREKWQETEHPSPFGTPMVLARVQCVGRFESVVDEGDVNEGEERVRLGECGTQGRWAGLAVTRKKDSKW